MAVSDRTLDIAALPVGSEMSSYLSFLKTHGMVLLDSTPKAEALLPGAENSFQTWFSSVSRPN